MPVSRQKPRNPGEGRGTFPKKVLRILLNCLLVPLCLFALAQCGLEYVPYLTPPRSLTKSPTAFRVRKDAANDSEFVVGEWEYQGIELYYKFYVPGIEVPPILDKSYTKLSELEDNGFHRISRYTPPGDDDQTDIDKAIRKPVLEIDIVTWTGNVDFVIDMVNLTIKDQPPEDPPPPPPATLFVEQIRRGVSYDPSTEVDKYPFFQQFISDDFDAADDDAGSDLYDYIANTPGGPIIMAMYALSYGKIEGLLDLHSDAVYLGDISINFGW
jgi:hypothetical protein